MTEKKMIDHMWSIRSWLQENEADKKSEAGMGGIELIFGKCFTGLKSKKITMQVKKIIIMLKKNKTIL